MNDVSLQLLHDLSVVSGRDAPELISIYATAAETLGLSTIDYLTIRDLMRFAGSNDISLHLLLLAMFVSLSEGSVCLKLDRRSLEKKLRPVTGAAADRLFSEILECPGRHHGLVHTVPEESLPSGGDPRDAYKPLILVEREDGRYLYFQKYYSAERAMTGSLSGILARPPSHGRDPVSIAPAMTATLREKPVTAGGTHVHLNREQLLAVILPLLNNFVLISGGPGTGKTFIVLTLLRVMVRMGTPPSRIMIAAPTGRAAQRLTDSIRGGIASIADPDGHDRGIAALQGTTIHRLLGYGGPRNDFFYNRYNPLPADLVVIDEASMIDIVLLARLFEAIGPDAGLVLLGDRNQLPSVEAGAVLTGLIPGERASSYSSAALGALSAVMPGIEIPPGEAATVSGDASDPMTDRVVILETSYRSEESITIAARKIIAQDISVIDDIPALDPRGVLPMNGVWRIEPDADDFSSGLRRLLLSWTARQHDTERLQGVTWKEMLDAVAGTDLAAARHDPSGPLHRIMSSLDDWRILTPLRAGLSGAAGINEFLRFSHIAARDPSAAGRIYSGAPIIITRNDYDRGLFNGDSGLVLLSSDGRYYGVFNRADGLRLFPAEALPPYDLSYAITVHKSQGSEYGRVLLVLPGAITASLLTTEILYTGLTRAKHLAVIYASRETLAGAIRNRIERESGPGISTRRASTA